MRFLALLVLLLAACGRPAPAIVHRAELGPTVAAPDPRVGCNMRVQAPWRGSSGYQVIADAVGVDCANASVSLTIAGADGGTHMSASFLISQLAPVFGDDAARARLDRAGMERALTHWIDPDAPERRLSRANNLPAWPHRQDMPRATGALYTPGQNMSRASYEALRAEKRPLFCYQADTQTLRCSALLPDGTIVLMATGRRVS